MDKQRHSQKGRTRLFISHSSEDRELARALSTLLDSALSVPPKAIRCTSDPRYNLVPGEDVPQKLRGDLDDSNVVLGLLTPSSVISSYVLMELGAAWGFKRYVIPILGAGLNFNDIPGPIGRNINAVRAHDEAAMVEVLDIVSRECGMEVRVTAGGRHELVKQFAEKARTHRSRPSNPHSPVQDRGNYPAFLPNIIGTIKDAPSNSGIRIACDYVSYGIFSSGTLSDGYRDALMQAKTRGCTIEMLVLGSEPWKQMLAQVPAEHEEMYKELKRNEEFRKSIDALTDRLRKLEFPIPRTWTRASHLEAMVQLEHYYEKLLKGVGIQITTVPGPLPLYLWITKSSVIWALCPLEPQMRFPLIWNHVLTTGRMAPASPWDEHGFLSYDEGLVHRFTQVWRQYSSGRSHAVSTSER